MRAIAALPGAGPGGTASPGSPFALADWIEAGVAAAREKIETMRHSLLARAFSSRLVPTGVELARRERWEYEPASIPFE